MDNYGMTPEEAAKRQRLIDNLIANGNHELAADVAKGPYRINGNPQGQSPQGTWSAPPPQGQQYQPAQPYGEATQTSGSASLMQSPTIPPTPPTIPTYGQQGPTNKQGNYGGPPIGTGNPRYDFPQNAGGQPINININMPGQPQVGQAGFSRQGYGNEPVVSNEGAPGVQAGFSRQGYQFPQNATAQGPSRPRGYQNPAVFNSAPQMFDMGVKQPSFADQLSSEWQDFTQPGRGYQNPTQPGYQPPPLTGADFGPAQQMTDMGVRRPTPMAQIQSPFTNTGWGNLSR